MLVLGADLTHEQRRTVDSLPVDVVLIAPDGDGDSLTVKGLMDILTMAWGAGKPALLLWSGPLTTGELEGLRGADINGIVVDASKADKGVIEGLKGAIDSLPRKARRQRGGTAEGHRPQRRRLHYRCGRRLRRGRRIALATPGATEASVSGDG